MQLMTEWNQNTLFFFFLYKHLVENVLSEDAERLA